MTVPGETAKSEHSSQQLADTGKTPRMCGIILEIWGASKGGSQKYKDAEAQYDRIIGGKK